MNFQREYQRHLRLINQRGEKAHRKCFLKFIEDEDKLLYSLCDEKEFRANMLMKTAMASYGKLEADRLRIEQKQQLPQSNSRRRLDAIALSSAQLMGESEVDEIDNSRKESNSNGLKHSSRLYKDYMDKRLRVYDKTFENGNRKQKRLLRRMNKRRDRWELFKIEDQRIANKLEHKYPGVSKAAKQSPDYKAHLSKGMPDYSKTHLDGAVGGKNAGSSHQSREKLKGQLREMGILSDESIDNANNLSQLFMEAKEMLSKNDSTLTEKGTEKDRKQKGADPVSAKRFKDRIYGGFDFNWQRKNAYYPEGFGLSIIGGYKISSNSGVNLEGMAHISASGMGIVEDIRFDPQLVSHYSLGANADYRIWKFCFVGAGVEGIHNRLPMPQSNMAEHRASHPYSLGIPVIIKALLPTRGGSSTSIELRYDLNHSQNIKPALDFRIGYLIGRR